MVARTALLLILLVGACHHDQGARFPSNVGETVDLTLPALDGGDLSLSSYRGKIVIVHFVDTGSMAGLMDLDEERKVRSDDVVPIEVATDVAGYKLVAPWAQGAGIDWTVLLANDELRAGQTAFGSLTYSPVTFVLDRQGRIAWGRIGGLPRGLLARVVHSL